MKTLASVLCAALVLAGCAAGENAPKPERNIGIAMYTFHKRNFDEVAKTIKEMGVVNIGLSRTPLSAKFPKVRTNHYMTAEQRAYLKKIIADNGFKILSYGVVTPKDEAELKAVCEYAVEMGAPMVLTEAKGDMLALCQKYAEKYGLVFAVHNHARDPKRPDYDYYNPMSVKKEIAPYSRVFSCPDTGGWQLSGVNPADGLRMLEGTVKMVHLKDSNVFNDISGHSVPFGKGKGKLGEFLAEFDRQKLWDVCLMIEYEVNSENNDADVRECVRYLRNN
ncbi:MAG: sugar phosphate isomerase/epimerase [Opitutales bacterium]|nr:sugar phosphate isomerase/epimerase [Opitutales bacterium]